MYGEVCGARIPPTQAKRRDVLLAWMRERPQHDGLTARQIVDVSGIYDRLQGRQEKATHDLRALRKHNLVSTDGSIGGTWWVAI